MQPIFVAKIAAVGSMYVCVTKKITFTLLFAFET